MTDEMQILDSISATADMGRDSLNHVIEKANNAQLKNTLQKQFSEYDSAYKSAEDMIRAKGKNPQKIGAPVKAYSHLVSNIKTLTAEDTTSKIAEMVIQGSTMGVTEITRQLNDYHGNDQAIRSLAEKIIQTEQANIEEMKTFL